MKISDNKRTETIGGVRLPELEGHIRIELKDAKTGRLDKVVEGKNLVTDAVKDVFASNYFGSMNYRDLMPIMDFFFGGILCFHDALTENAKNYYIPAYGSNSITAHAGDLTPSTPQEWAADTTRGGETSASGEVTGGYSRVFFFPETQGNDKISAIAFTHKDIGNFYPHGMANTYPVYVNQTGQSGYNVDGQNQLVFVDRTNRIGYILTISGTTLTVKKVESYGMVEGIGLLQKHPDGVNADTTTSRVSSHTFTMPVNCNIMRYMFFEGDQELHCIAVSGNTITRRIIDLTNMTMTSDAPEISGASMAAFTNNSSVVPLPINLDVDGHMYIAGTNKIYRIDYLNILTEPDPKEVAYTGGFASYDNTIRGIGHMGFGQMSRVLTNGTTYAVQTAQLTGFTNWGWNSPNFCKPVYVDNELVAYSSNTNTNANDNSAKQTQPIYNKMFMSTIKNLEEPVTKLSTQSMTITYTITEAQEEEEAEE